MNLTYGTLCSGIESASVAVEPLGWKAVWFAEIEPFPSAVLAHHYPDVPNLGDMTHVGAQVRIGDEQAPDVLIAGTPCQAFSVAGAREGLADERGQLTLEYVKLIDDVDHVRSENNAPPTIDVWENVPGVLSSKDNAFGCFLGALSGADCELQPPGKRWPNSGCVYGPKRAIAWRVLDAQYFGVAQRRRRVFVIASARKGFHPAQVLLEREGVRRDHPPRRGEGARVAGTLTGSLGKNGGIPAGNDCAPSNLIAGTLQAGGKAAGSATLQDAESGLLVAFGGSANCKETDVSTALSAHPGGTRMDAETETFVVHGTQDPDVLGDMAHTLKAEGFDASEDGTGRGQPIVPVAWAIGSHAGAAEADQSNRSHASGGPVGSNISAECAYSLRAGRTQSVATPMQVRRLTPRECERLQGFPDDYTLIPYGRGIRPEKLDADYAKYLMRGGQMTYEQCLQAAADGPRYKAIGNSKAVPVVRWIAKRIEWALQHPWENDL